MAQIFIEKLKLFNFRNYEERNFEFKTQNIITGDNGLGKSSIGEAIVYGLYGITMNGSDRCDPLIKIGKEKMAVEVAFVGPDNQRHIICRVKTNKYTRVKLDGKETTQEEIENILGVNKKLFLSVFNNSYLRAESLVSPAETRKFFAEILPLPEHEAVLKQLGDEERSLITKNDNGDNLSAKEITEKLKHLQDYLTTISGNQSELRRQLEGLSQSESYKPEELEAIDKQIIGLKEKKSSVKIDPPPAKAASVDIKTLEEQLLQHRENYKLLRNQLIRELPEEPKANISCNTCNQPLPEKIISHLHQEWQKKVAAIKEHNTQINERLKEMSAEGVRLTNIIEQAKVNSDEDTFQNEYDQWEAKTKEQQKEIAKIEQQLEEIFEKRATILVAQKLNSQRETMETQLKEVTEAIKLAQDEKQHLEKLKEAYKKYYIKQSEMMMTSIKKQLDKASIRLFEVNKSNSELRPVFKILYDDKPIPFLSTSEQIRVGLELSKMIMNIVGIKIPLFIDCCESISKFTCGLPDIQTFCAFVEPDTELSVLCEGELPEPTNAADSQNITSLPVKKEDTNKEPTLFEIA